MLDEHVEHVGWDCESFAWRSSDILTIGNEWKIRRYVRKWKFRSNQSEIFYDHRSTRMNIFFSFTFLLINHLWFFVFSFKVSLSLSLSLYIKVEIKLFDIYWLIRIYRYCNVCKHESIIYFTIYVYIIIYEKISIFFMYYHLLHHRKLINRQKIWIFLLFIFISLISTYENLIEELNLNIII